MRFDKKWHFFCVISIRGLWQKDSVRISTLDHLQHRVTKIQQNLDFFTVFRNDHGVEGSILLIGGIVIFDKTDASAVFPVFCYGVMPVGSEDLQGVYIKVMCGSAVLFAEDDVDSQVVVFQDVFIFLLAVSVVEVIENHEKKTRKHEALRDCDAK